MNFTSVTNSFSQKNSISLAYSSKHPRVLENSSYFFWKILNYKRKNPKLGEFQVKISDERQGKTFRGSIVWTLNLLPAFLSGCLLSYSLRYDFQKIIIYLSQLNRTVLRKLKTSIFFIFFKISQKIQIGQMSYFCKQKTRNVKRHLWIVIISYELSQKLLWPRLNGD